MRRLAWRASLQSYNRRIKASLFLLFVRWDRLRLLKFLFIWLLALLALFFLLLFHFFRKIGFFSPKLFLSLLLLSFCLFLLLLSFSHKLFLLFFFNLFPLCNDWDFNLGFSLFAIRDWRQ